MPEIRTAPVRAQFLPASAFDTFYRRCTIAGAICREPPGEDAGWWWFSCPCGCGKVGRLRVGEGVKPERSPSWAWTGGEAAATLMPSVWDKGHWHGWLKAGVWECA